MGLLGVEDLVVPLDSDVEVLKVLDVLVSFLVEVERLIWDILSSKDFQVLHLT